MEKTKTKDYRLIFATPEEKKLFYTYQRMAVGLSENEKQTSIKDLIIEAMNFYAKKWK